MLKELVIINLFLTLFIEIFCDLVDLNMAKLNPDFLQSLRELLP